MLAAAFYLLLGLGKMRHYLASGRLWAEEGTFFFHDIAAAGWLDGLFYQFNSHVELMTNLVIMAGTSVDLRYAPLVTSYLSFALQSLPVILLLCFRHSLHLNRLAVFGVIVVLAGIPQAKEVWANAINLHFHFALALGLIIAIPIADQRRYRWVMRVVVLCCGLSGIPAHFLAPVLCYRAWQERDRERWIQLAILGACTLMQLALIASAGSLGRELVFDPVVYALVALYQNGCLLLLGYPGSKVSEAFIRQALGGDGVAVAGVVIALGVVAFCLVRAGVQSLPRRFLLLGALCLSYASFVTALGDDRSMMISRLFGLRYFFASNVLFAVVLFGTLGLRRNLLVIACAVVATLAALRGVNATFKGPDWREAYDTAAAEQRSRVEIWPRGWYLQLPEGTVLTPSGIEDRAAE